MLLWLVFLALSLALSKMICSRDEDLTRNREHEPAHMVLRLVLRFANIAEMELAISLDSII